MDQQEDRHIFCILAVTWGDFLRQTFTFKDDEAQTDAWNDSYFSHEVGELNLADLYYSYACLIRLFNFRIVFRKNKR